MKNKLTWCEPFSLIQNILFHIYTYYYISEKCKIVSQNEWGGGAIVSCPTRLIISASYQQRDGVQQCTRGAKAVWSFYWNSSIFRKPGVPNPAFRMYVSKQIPINSNMRNYCRGSPMPTRDTWPTIITIIAFQMVTVSTLQCIERVVIGWSPGLKGQLGLVCLV